MADVENIRSRLWNVLLYPDDPSHASAIEAFKNGSYASVGICHDKDTDENGNLLKPHFHIVVKFKNAIWRNSLADSLGIAPNYLEVCRDFKNSAAYLLHKNNPEKYQYDVEEAFGTLKPALLKLLDDDTEDMKALRILDILDGIKEQIRYSDFIRLCAEQGLWSDLRRGGYIFVQAVKEHNEQYAAF